LGKHDDPWAASCILGEPAASRFPIFVNAKFQSCRPGPATATDFAFETLTLKR